MSLPGFRIKSDSLLVQLLYEVAGSALLAAGIVAFSAPNEVVSGGVSGISVVLNHLFGLPIGTMNFILNVPLFILGWKKLGRDFILRTLRVVAISSVLTDLASAYLPVYRGEQLFAALFGGVLMGAGLGIILMRGSTTGGTDIVVKLIHLRFRHLSMGTAVMITDLAVVLWAASVYGSIDSALLSIIMIFSASTTIDRILAGNDERRLVLAISPRKAEIARAVTGQLERGVTLVDAVGGYSSLPTGLIICVVDNRQLYSLKCIINSIDSRAFIIVTRANEILGEGFKDLSGDVK